MLEPARSLTTFLLENTVDIRFAAASMPRLMPLLERIEKREFRLPDGVRIDSKAVRHAVAASTRTNVTNMRFIMTADPFDCAVLEDKATGFTRNRSLSRYLDTAWGWRANATDDLAFSPERWNLLRDKLSECLHQDVAMHLPPMGSRLAGPLRTEARESVYMTVRMFSAAILRGDAKIADALLPLIACFDSVIPIGKGTDDAWLAVILPLRTPIRGEPA